MCTSIIAGGKATADEVILLSRNEDYPRTNWNKYLAHRSRPQYRSDPLPTGGKWTLGNGLTVPVPEKAYSYSAMPDAAGPTEAPYGIGDLFFFEERGINERNVGVSASNSLKMNPKASAADPLSESGGVAESIIPTLLLPQVDTAIGAVTLLGHYIETYGASEVNGVLIGDPGEAWYFENGSAHHWIAVRVPEDCYLAAANGMRVHDVDLDSSDVLCSSGLYEFVLANRLLDAPDRHRFDFAGAFGVLGDSYNDDRVWLAQSILTPSLEQEPRRKQQYPLFLRPDRPIRARDVMNVLRATYEGTALEGVADRPIALERTAESHIITLDRDMPFELQGLIWQALSTPLGAPYMPLFAVMDDIPPGYRAGDNRYSGRSAYWAFRASYALAELSGRRAVLDLVERWQEHEAQSLEELEHIRPMLKEMYARNRGAAVDYAKRYSTGAAFETASVAHRMKADLITRIAAPPSGDPEAGTWICGSR